MTASVQRSESHTPSCITSSNQWIHLDKDMQAKQKQTNKNTPWANSDRQEAGSCFHMTVSARTQDLTVPTPAQSQAEPGGWSP